MSVSADGKSSNHRSLEGRVRVPAVEPVSVLSRLRRQCRAAFDCIVRGHEAGHRRRTILVGDSVDDRSPLGVERLRTGCLRADSRHGIARKTVVVVPAVKIVAQLALRCRQCRPYALYIIGRRKTRQLRRAVVSVDIGDRLRRISHQQRVGELLILVGGIGHREHQRGRALYRRRSRKGRTDKLQSRRHRPRLEREGVIRSSAGHRLGEINRRRFIHKRDKRARRLRQRIGFFRSDGVVPVGRKLYGVP